MSKRVGLRHISSVGTRPPVVLLNPAWAYANTIGTIYLEKRGAYGEGHSGQVYLWDVPSAYGGAYVNRA